MNRLFLKQQQFWIVGQATPYTLAGRWPRMLRSTFSNHRSHLDLPYQICQASVNSLQVKVYNQARKSLEQSAWLGHLWEKSPEKENWEGFNFAQTPHLSHIYLPSRRTVFCVLERSTPFQLKCHSQISGWRGKRRSTHALFFQHLIQTPALGSAHSATTIPALHQEGPLPRPRPQTGLPSQPVAPGLDR